jgi:hypothetical protein
VATFPARMLKCEVGAGLTVNPMIAVVSVLAGSVIEIVSLPAVANVALNVPTPLVNEVVAGKMALGSLLLNCRRSVKPVSVLAPFRTVTVKVMGVPAVAVVGALTATWSMYSKTSAGVVAETPAAVITLTSTVRVLFGGGDVTVMLVEELSVIEVAND